MFSPDIHHITTYFHILFTSLHILLHGPPPETDHQPLESGETGLIRVRAQPMVTGYLGNPGATAERFRDGWFYPMDVGFLDESGQLNLTGRSDDVTIRFNSPRSRRIRSARLYVAKRRAKLRAGSDT